MNRRTAAVIAIAAAVFLAAVAGGVWWTVRRVHRDLTTPVEKTVDLGDLVTQVREMSRLETAAMHVVNVSTITQSYKYVPKSLGGDQITLYAEGDVIAGIDLARVQNSDVWREPDGTLVIRLPDPQVLFTRVDNGRTRVVNRKTGFLRGADPGLESRLRVFAEGSIRSEALRKGILPMASENGAKKLAAFLHTMGMNRMKFVTATGARVPL